MEYSLHSIDYFLHKEDWLDLYSGSYYNSKSLQSTALIGGFSLSVYARMGNSDNTSMEELLYSMLRGHDGYPG